MNKDSMCKVMRNWQPCGKMLPNPKQEVFISASGACLEVPDVIYKLCNIYM